MVVARHEWLRPGMDVSTLDQMWSNAELGLGGDNYFIHHVVGISPNVTNVPLVFSNLTQIKEEFATPQPLTLEGLDVGDLSTMRVTGVDGDLNFVEKDYTLTGTVGVDIGSWQRVMLLEWAGGPALISGAFIYKTGAASKALTAPTTFLYAPAEFPEHPGVSAHRSYDGGFIVPKGYESYISGFQFAPDKNVAYFISAQAKPVGDIDAPWQTIYCPRVNGGRALDYKFNWRRIPELWQGRVIVAHDSGTANATCELNYQVLMVRKGKS